MARRRVWIAVGAVLFAGLATLAAWAWHATAGVRRFFADTQTQLTLYGRPFEPYVAELEAAGVCVDVETIDGPMPPDAENAAGEIDAAWNWVIATMGPQSSWPMQDVWDAPGPMEQIAAIGRRRVEFDAFLLTLRPFFARVSAALDRPHVRHAFAADPTDGWPDNSWIRNVQAVQRLLNAAAIGASRPEDRLAAIRDCARLGARLEDTALIPEMVAVALTCGAANAVRLQLMDCTIDASAARRALDALFAPPMFPRMAPLLRHERAEAIWLFRGMRDGTVTDPDPSGSSWPTKEQLAKPNAGFQTVGECEIIGEALSWVELGHAEWRRRFQPLLERTGMTRHTFAIVAPKMVDAFARADAMTRLCRASLAVGERRATSGEFPASLDDLKPMFPDGVPLDPFTDAPFVYEKTAAGVRIASVGRLPEDAPLDDATLRERCLVWELKR